MKRPVLFLLLLCLVLPLAAGLIAQAGTCIASGDDSDGAKTMGGSCKNNAGNLKCGTTGQITQAGTVHLLANTNANQTEVEACNDTGAGNQQGRLVGRVNHSTTNPGARFSLDSDADQTPADICCGYINAQVGSEGTGVWCSEDAQKGDGYARPWNNPGDDGGDGSKNETADAPAFVECVPTQ